jgi:acetoacetate decarboxylase
MTGLSDRRRILKLGACALASATLPLRAQTSGSSKRLLFRYRTDAERLARLIPPGLEPAEDPVVEVELEWFEPESPDLLTPEPYGTARFSVAVRHGETAGRLPVAVYASNDRSRLVSREAQGLPAKDAEIEFESGSEGVLASVSRRGRTIFKLFAVFSDDGGRTGTDLPLLVPVFRPNPDWRRELIPPGTAELWRIDAPAGGYGSAAYSVEADFPFASPGDPIAELPVEETLGVWRWQATALEKAQKVADLDPAALAAWAPLRYDRPVERERFWMPEEWRDKTTAFHFTGAEMTRYQERQEILLEPLEIVEIDAMISREAHEALVPPICRTAGRPMIKVLGLRVGAGALSPVPFSELWLFAFTITDNRMAWYAVSHIVGEGGDLTFGRDVYGYPSKSGDPEIVVTPVNFSLGATRMGRELVYADGPFHGFSTGTSLAQLPMVSLRAKPGGGGAELVYQMWTFQGRRNRVDPAGFQMGFPNAAAKGLDLNPDPWYELGLAQTGLVSVMESAVMQRAPGEVVAELPQFEEYYRERCDGVLPWEPRPAELVQPTMLARRPSGSSS